MAEKKQADRPVGFEVALKRLETIVEEMESGDQDLDRMIAAFEEGQRLAAFCAAKLDEVERRIEKIVRAGPGGGVAVEPFEPTPEEN